MNTFMTALTWIWANLKTAVMWLFSQAQNSFIGKINMQEATKIVGMAIMAYFTAKGGIAGFEAIVELVGNDINNLFPTLVNSPTVAAIITGLFEFLRRLGDGSHPNGVIVLPKSETVVVVK